MTKRLQHYDNSYTPEQAPAAARWFIMIAGSRPWVVVVIEESNVV
jgi:hypothetical protein